MQCLHFGTVTQNKLHKQTITNNAHWVVWYVFHQLWSTDHNCWLLQQLESLSRYPLSHVCQGEERRPRFLYKKPCAVEHSFEHETGRISWSGTEVHICHTYVIHVHTRVMHFGQMILTWVYINTYMRLQVTTWRPSLKKSNLLHSSIDPIITLKAHQSQQKSRKSSSQEVLQSAICRIFPQSVGAQVELSVRSSGWLATGLRWHQMFGNLPQRKVVKRHWVSLTWVIELMKQSLYIYIYTSIRIYIYIRIHICRDFFTLWESR